MDVQQPIQLPEPLEALANVAEHPEKLVVGDAHAREAALAATKYIFDLCKSCVRNFIATLWEF